MKIYIVHLKLNDFLTFSSTVGFTSIGRVSYTVYKPQPYLHNYALMYGFTGLLYASLASLAGKNVRDIKREIDYSGLDEIEKKLYVYPARPKRLNVKRLLANVKGEGFVEIQTNPKGAYPWHVIHVWFTPGTEFETVLVADDKVRIPNTIRIGVKRQGVFTVKLEPAKIEGTVDGLSDPVNLGDLMKRGIRPRQAIILLRTKTVRKNVPYSNIIARIYHDNLTIIKGENTEFFLPLLPTGETPHVLPK